MARKNKQVQNDAWGANPAQANTLSRVPDEVPRARSIAAKKTLRFRLTRILVWACVIAVPVAGLTILGINNSMGVLSSKINSVPNPDSVTSPGKATATTGMEEWLAMKPAPLMGGRIVSWDGFSDIPKPEQTAQEAKSSPLPDYEFEVHNFTLADENDNLYTSSIQVAVGPGNSGSIVVGSPSLMAIPPSASISVPSPWYGFARAAAGDSVTQSVEAWASAYTGGDPASLRLAVGDSDSGHSYMPLYGITDVEVKVTSAAYVPPTGEAAEKYKSGSPTETMIAQVELTITWDGAPELEQGERNSTVVTYDLLILKADTASPQVVAWGAPGTAPELEAYGNALTDNDVKGQDSKKSPTPKPTDDSTEEEEN